MEAEGSADVVDIDLNEEPTEASGDYQENMESVYTRIEERIRRLEAVTLRARQRPEWRLATEAVNEEPLSLNGENIGLTAGDDVRSEALIPVSETGLDGLKRSDSRLLALALELEGEAQAKKNSGEAFFDCNICLAKARDPILTCCGHLYCWPCFYQLPDVGMDTKECPACKGEVKGTGITPIYGSSDKALKRKFDGSGVHIPPRPQANRIESLRQQRITRGSNASRIEEVLRGLRSFSTLSRNLSSALSSAERIVEDLEGMAHMHPSAGHRYQVVFDADTNSHFVVTVPSESPDADGVIDTDAGLPSSSTSAAGNATTSADNAFQPDPAASLPRRISPRRRIHSQGHFTDVTIGMQRRSSLRSRTEQREQLRSILRARNEQAPALQDLSSSRTEQREQLRSILRGRTEQREQLRSILRGRTELQAPSLQNLSRVQHPPQIDSPNLLPVRVVTAHSSLAHNDDGTVSSMPETSVTALPSSSRRRADTSEASGSGTPEPRRRRLR